MKLEGMTKIMRVAFLIFLSFIFLAACQGKKAPASANEPAAEAVTLDNVQSVLGTANDYASGALDISRGDNEVIVTYRYYDVDLQNYETDFASEIAPRIQAFYKKYKTLGRVHFQVTANSASTTGLWQPFTEFSLDRRTVEEIHWTGFLARYLLDLVIKNKKT